MILTGVCSIKRLKCFIFYFIVAFLCYKPFFKEHKTFLYKQYFSTLSANFQQISVNAVEKNTALQIIFEEKRFYFFQINFSFKYDKVNRFFLMKKLVCFNF